MTDLLYLFIPMTLVMIVSPWAISLCRGWGLVDYPDERKLHKEPMPLAGGIILFPFVVAGFLFAFRSGENLLFLLAGEVLIFGLGLWDDRRGSHFSTKFMVQIIAAFLIIQSGLFFDLNKVFNTLGPAAQGTRFFSLAFTLLWIVGITNAVNIVDGMDGLAGGLCLTAFVGTGSLALVSGRSGLAIFSLIMVGALAGLLKYNIHPARTFLGDSGSMLLGFTLAVLSIIQSTKTATFLVVVVPALLLGLPVMDTVFAFTRRGVKGQNPFKPDRGHLHHRLMDLHFSQLQVLGVLFSLSSGLGIIALWLAETRKAHILALGIFLMLFAVAVIKGLQVYNFHESIRQINVRMRAVALKAVRRERSAEERLMRNFSVLTVLFLVNILVALWFSQKSFVIAAGALGLFVVGLTDVLTTFREEEHRFEILHVVLFLSLLLNQIGILVIWHRDYLIAPRMAFSALLVLFLLVVFVYRMGTLSVFLQNPMEILALYFGVVLCGITKHFLALPAFLPFVVVLANSLALYVLLKVYLVGYRMRSLTYSLGFVACTAVLVSVPWWR